MVRSAQKQTSEATSNSDFQSTDKAQLAILKQDYAAAAALLRSQGFSPAVRNNLGVCLMRLGQIDEALKVFRSFILESGGVYERAEASDAARRNFATVLILKQIPTGSISVLERTKDQNHPQLLKLQNAIAAWEATLGWFHWLNWKINRVAPPRCHILLDFELGEFEAIPTMSPSSKPSKSTREAA